MIGYGMIGFVMVGTNNLQTSAKFYDLILLPLGLTKVFVGERYIGYASKDNKDEIEFYITKPHNQEKATYGNGTQISFLADSKLSVDKFYNIALQNGGLDEGSPGPRPSDTSGYYAYIRDFSGNKICAYAKI